MRASEAQPILDAFGYLQHGLITSAQASASGIDSTTMTRLCQRDIIRRVRRGVYILAGVAEDTLTEIRAAWLATSPHVVAEERLNEENPIVVSHVSAASVLGLGDITPAHHMFSSPVRKQSSAADVRHRVAALPSGDITVVEGLPVTTPLRTAADLAKDRLDGDQLHHVIASAIHDHHVKTSLVSTCLAPYAGSYGYGSGQELVAESLQRFPEDESAAEARSFSALSQALRGSSGSLASNIFAHYGGALSPLGVSEALEAISAESSSLWKTLAQPWWFHGFGVLGPEFPQAVGHGVLSSTDIFRDLGIGESPSAQVARELNRGSDDETEQDKKDND